MNGLTQDRQSLYSYSEHLMYSILGDNASFGEAARIIDTAICILIDQSTIPDKEACLARVMTEFLGGYFSYEELANCRADVLEKYGFAENLQGLGTVWKQAIWDKNERTLECLVYWLQCFREEMLPVIDEMVGAYEAERGVSQAERKQQYKAYRIMLNRCARELEAVKEILPMLKSVY